MINSFFFIKQGLGIYLSFCFLLILLCGLPGIIIIIIIIIIKKNLNNSIKKVQAKPMKNYYDGVISLSF